MPVVAIFIANFLIAGAASVYAAVDDHTVVGKNPQGTVINLFDYWADVRRMRMILHIPVPI